jgi:hypothetical protein
MCRKAHYISWRDRGVPPLEGTTPTKRRLFELTLRHPPGDGNLNWSHTAQRVRSAYRPTSHFVFFAAACCVHCDQRINRQTIHQRDGSVPARRRATHTDGALDRHANAQSGQRPAHRQGMHCGNHSDSISAHRTVNSAPYNSDRRARALIALWTAQDARMDGRFVSCLRVSTDQQGASGLG